MLGRGIPLVLQARDGITFVTRDRAVQEPSPQADLIHVTRDLNLRFRPGLRRGSTRRTRRSTYSRRRGRCSGGQQARSRWHWRWRAGRELLVLDEPIAMLDPLARHDFMATVMSAVAEDGVSVVLSSQVLAELERVADFLVLVSRGTHSGRG